MTPSFLLLETLELLCSHLGSRFYATPLFLVEFDIHRTDEDQKRGFSAKSVSFDEHQKDHRQANRRLEEATGGKRGASQERVEDKRMFARGIEPLAGRMLIEPCFRMCFGNGLGYHYPIRTDLVEMKPLPRLPYRSTQTKISGLFKRRCANPREMREVNRPKIGLSWLR